MIKLTPTAFEEVFGGIDLSSNVRTNLRESYVSNIMFIKNTNTFTVDINAPKIVDEDCIEHFKADIRDNFPFAEKIELNIKYDIGDCQPEARIEMYWDNLLKSIRRRSQYAYMALNDSRRSLCDEKYIIELKNNSAYMLTKMHIDDYIRDMFRKRLDLPLKIELVNGEPVEMINFIKEYSPQDLIKMSMERDAQQTAQSEEKPQKGSKKAEKAAKPVQSAPRPAAPKGDGLFKKRAPRSSVNLDEITMPVTKINDLRVVEQEYAVSGRIIFVETTETRKGSLIVKFGITDKTNSVMAKFFSKPEEFEADFADIIKPKNMLP
ncbi:MAG: hypothetical protein IJR59_01640 [Firmicutes bacterium]|nr:hypothetical protein [Bacillota bacterium]